jgi:hypothetical protein
VARGEAEEGVPQREGGVEARGGAQGKGWGARLWRARASSRIVEEVGGCQTDRDRVGGQVREYEKERQMRKLEGQMQSQH